MKKLGSCCISTTDAAIGLFTYGYQNYVLEVSSRNDGFTPASRAVRGDVPSHDL